MFAETEKEKDDWIGAIGRHVLFKFVIVHDILLLTSLTYFIIRIRSIVKHSSMYVKDDEDSEESEAEDSDDN